MKWLTPTHRCHLEWGHRGARDAAARGDIVIVVDVLSFCSTVVTALAAGAEIVPARDAEEGRRLATHLRAELAVKRKEVPAGGTFSLSPLTFTAAAAGQLVVVPSPNGAACAQIASRAQHLLLGSLLNASALAAYAERLAHVTELNVTVVPAGEQWPGTGDMRVAVEDYLGAGAILSRMKLDKSPEAFVCEAAFGPCREMIPGILWESTSGRELEEMGFGSDVRHCARTDAMHLVPVAATLDQGVISFAPGR